jgi:acetyl-CoA C-acetyltransferase
MVEIIQQLRGEAGKERQLEKSEVGLTQSIGGLGNNNIVTILERSDRRKMLGEGWKLDYHPELKVLKKEIVPPPAEGTGLLETFTVLYATPEGFRSPLALSLVQAKGGERVMACNPDYRNPRELRMGQRVHLEMREGLYLFEKRAWWKGLKNWWNKELDL